jgi:hypothetical protein
MTRLYTLLGLTIASYSAAQTPLHQRVDQLIESGVPNFNKVAVPLADDAEFLRRATIDLNGTIPTVEKTKAFLADKSPGKRAKLIDDLLASPLFAHHFASVLDVTLMERRPAKAKVSGWDDFLHASVAANKPWDQLVREILASDGADPKTRPASRFLLDRDGEPHLITRDIGRLFLGMDFQCAQCHDHPLIDDYKQDMYYGVFAFLNRTSVVNDAGLKMTVLSEKADGEVSYQSVFDPMKVTKTSLPRVLSQTAIKDAEVKKGEEYITKPDKSVRGVPKYSRRSRLAAEVARVESEPFKQNIANRLWAHLMGQGIVHPLDMSHSHNPPSHPELLKLLGDEIASHKYDMKYLLRELALTKTYQRSSWKPSGVEVPARKYTLATMKPLSPEVLAFALYEATGNMSAERAALSKGMNEGALYKRVSGTVAPLVKTFEGQAGMPQSFDPSLDQALFLSNSAVFKGWVSPRGNNLAARLAAMKDEQVAEEAYLSVLTRQPTADEKSVIQEYLKSKDRAATITEIVWALATSAAWLPNAKPRAAIGGTSHGEE